MSARTVDLLQVQGANLFRVGAYRKAAETLARLPLPVRDLFDDKAREGLETLPGIGRGLALSIAEMLMTRRWAQLQRLRREINPERLFQVVPRIGPDLARQIHETLHVDTLDALELACASGRLATVPGIGVRRAAAIYAALTAILDRPREPCAAAAVSRTDDPPVALLLEIDREYHERAAAGELKIIAPRRSILQAKHGRQSCMRSAGEWHFTILYSNTARAHERGRVRDWVVIHLYDDQHVERQHTIVTETRGATAGERVVRGREAECRAFYAEHAGHADA